MAETILALAERRPVTGSDFRCRLGRTFEISLNTYKPFPCGIVIHPSIDACLQLREEIWHIRTYPRKCHCYNENSPVRQE